MKKILVTGGAGYIGSHTVKELLKSGYKDIVVVDDLSTGGKSNLLEGVEFIEGDFGDEKILTKVFKSKIDSVLHFAASKSASESVNNPDKYYNNNISKSIKLLNFCIKNDVKNFIFSSSAAVYGNAQKFPIAETFGTKPTNPYGWTKLIFEQALIDYSAAYRMKHISLRYFNAGGADPEGRLGNDYKNREDLLSILMEVAKDNSQFTIFGNNYKTKDGTCVRDLIHVTDLAVAHIKALEYLENNENSEIINLGSEKGFTIKEITDMTKKITGSLFKIVEGDRRAGDIVISIASSKKAKNILGWHSQYSLEDIIKTAWNWQIK